MTDMTKDIFATHKYGKLALKRLRPTSKNFRLFSVGWLGNGPEREVLKVSGAEFRVAKTGKNKGLLTIRVPRTTRHVYLTAKEVK